MTGADDDNVDVDTGYQGTIQYVIAVQKTSGAADSMIELDSANALEDNTPRTHMKLANFTFVHRNPASGNTAAMLFRGKSDATLVNGVVTSPMACLRLERHQHPHGRCGQPETRAAGVPVGGHAVRRRRRRSSATGGVTAQQVADVFNAGTNNNAAFTASLTNTFVNGANETAVTATDPKTLDAAFDTTTYVGAVKDAS